MLDRLTRPDTVILSAAAALLAASLACGLIAPPLFGLLLVAAVVVAVIFLAFCFPTGFCVAWLLVTGMSLENDLQRPGRRRCLSTCYRGRQRPRNRPRLRLYGSFWASVGSALSGLGVFGHAATGLVHGLYPGVTVMDTVRSCRVRRAVRVCFARLPGPGPRR